MGVKIRALRQRPLSPIAASALRITNNVVLLPAHSTSGIAQSQAFSSLAANFPGTGLVNPMLLNGFGTALPSAIDPTDTDRGIYLPIPYCPVVQCSGGASSTGTFRWRGINHLGQPVYFIERKVNTTGAGSPFFQSRCAFSYIDSMEILEWGGTAADTFQIGANWDFVQTGSAGPVKRIPLPMPITTPSEFAGISIVELGGAVWAATPWAPGDQLLRWTTGSGQDLQSMPTDPEFHTGLVALGRASTPPTSNWRILVSQLSPTRQPGLSSEKGLHISLVT